MFEKIEVFTKFLKIQVTNNWCFQTVSKTYSLQKQIIDPIKLSTMANPNLFSYLWIKTKHCQCGLYYITMKSNFTIKVSKTWRSSKFLMIWVCFWNFQTNTNDFSFGVYAIQHLKVLFQMVSLNEMLINKLFTAHSRLGWDLVSSIYFHICVMNL